MRFIRKSAVVQVVCLLLLLSSAVLSHAQSLIAFETPQQGYAAANGQFIVTIDLKAGAQPSTLRVASAYTDVTSLFNVGACAQAPCTLSATLTTSLGIVAGQNFLTASVLGTGGAAQTAHMQFGGAGLTDPTNGSAPGNVVSIQQTTTSAASTITIAAPTPVTLRSCQGSSTYIRIGVLNRSTLALKSTSCYAEGAVSDFLGSLDESDLVVVVTNVGQTYDALDFTSIGGSKFNAGDFTQYSAIGYGKAAPGVAHEAWTDPHLTGTAFASVRGNLINTGCQSLYGLDSSGNTVSPTTVHACVTNQSATLYSFLATNNTGFAILPGAAGTEGNPGLPTIYVGNPSNVPVGDSSIPTNQIRPINSNTGKDLFSYATYTPNWPQGNWAGGVYLVVLNSIDLSVISQNAYVTNCGSSCGSDHTNDNTALTNLANALTFSNSTNTNPRNQIYLFTTVGIPFSYGSDTAPLISAVAALGISPYALQAVIPDALGTPAGTGFSFVATSLQPNPPTTPDSDATPNNPQKLWSSSADTQQGETGALRGVFVQGNNSFYAPTDVDPFNVSELPAYATGDDYLSHADSYALGSTEPVAWPFMDTPGGRAAYSYLSTVLINYNLFTGGNPNSNNECSSECDDIRFWYTGDQASSVYTPLSPAQVQYPGDSTATAKGFTKADFDNVQQQLDLEQIYLKEVLALKAYAEEMNTESSQNVALSLTQSGTNIALDLQNQLGYSQTQAGETPVRVAADSFNFIAGAVSAGIPFFNPDEPLTQLAKIAKIGLPVADGVFWAASAILTIVADYATTETNTQPDPYVLQLQQLIGQSSNEATAAATNFNANLESTTGIFYNGVFSDWFRLQSAGLMSVNEGNNGWYIADTDQDNVLSAKNAAIVAGLRTELWRQVLQQQFSKAQYNNLASAYWVYKAYPTLGDLLSVFSINYPLHWADFPDRPACGPDCKGINVSPEDNVQAGWAARTNPSSPLCSDVTYIFQNNNFGKLWTTTIGATLLGAPTSTNGLSNLNIDPNWLMDEWGIPWFAKTTDGFPMNFPQNIIDNTQYVTSQFGIYETDYACAAHSQPWSGLYPVAFSGFSISPSATITAGATASVTISGKISATGTSSIPTGSVSITLNNVIHTAAISNSDGSFSSTFAVQSIPGSPIPYVFAISYDGAGQFASGSDVSQTLTVLSPDVDVQLSADVNPSYYGQAVTLTALVRSQAGTPTGTVSFNDSSALVGSTSLDPTGRAQLTLNQLPAGTHLITATYGGTQSTPEFSAGTSDLLYVTVNPLTTTYAGPATQYFALGTSTVHLEGQLVGKGGSAIINYPPANETVSVTVNNITQAATITTQGNFALDLPITGLGVGTYPLQITYSGDNNFTALVDQSTNLAIMKATTTFGALTPSQTIQSGTTSITLSGNLVTRNAIVPTGTVSVTINGVTSAPVTLGAGTFSLTFDTSTLPVETTAYNIQYNYSGDNNYVDTTDVSTTLTVLQTAASVIFRNLSPSQAIGYGQPTVTLSGTISTPPQTGGVLLRSQAGGTLLSFYGDVSNPLVQANTSHATVSAWINTTDKSKQLIISADDTFTNSSNSDDFGRMSLYIQGDQVGVQWDGTDPYATDDWLSADQTAISDGQWHHIAVVFGVDQASGLWNARLYKDGVSTGETFPQHLYALNYVSHIGGYVADPSFAPFSGRLWNLKIWNTALSTSALAADMYRFYTTSVPGGLLLATYFDPVSQLTQNVALVQPTPAAGLVISDQLPAQPPPSGETVRVTVGATPKTATIGLLGSFKVDFPTATIEPGSYAIQYKYSGDATFSAVTDATTQLIVHATATTTSLSSSANSSSPIVYGSPVTFTATVSASNATPQGTVTFYDGNTAIGPGELLNAGTALFSTSSLAIGTHSITASYPGTTEYSSSDSAAIPITIQALTPLFTNLTSSTVSYGTPSVTLGGVISAGGAVPTGSVLISVNGSSIPPASALIKPDGSFSASLNTSQLAMGTYQITYLYNANGNFGTASNNSTQLIVGLGSTSTAIVSSGSPAAFASNVTFTASVTSTADTGTPTGSITFQDGGVAIGSPVALSNGQAQLVISSLAAGRHSITAVYSGDAKFTGSTSNALTQRITALQPLFNILTPSLTIPAGTQNVTFGGQISAGTYIPSGTVSIILNGVTTPATIQSDGSFSASVDTHSLVINSYVVTFEFAAAGNFKAVSDSSTRLTVTSLSTETAIQSSSPTAVFGSILTFTATVSSASGTPTGTVTFMSGATALGTVPLSNGSAVYTANALPAGTTSIIASYSGDLNFSRSQSAALLQTVTQNATTFSTLTPSQTILPGTQSIDVAGRVWAPAGPQGGSAVTTTASGDGNVGVFFATVNDADISTDAVTFSVWINTTTKAQQMILQETGVNPAIYLQNDQITLAWQGAGGPWTSTDTRAVSDGQWHHIAVSLDQGKITFYKDGIATADSFSVDSKMLSDGGVNFGGGAWNGIPSFTGQMWNGEIWASASSASAIQAQMFPNYNGAYPAALRLLTGFDGSAGTATNLVDPSSATSGARTTGVSIQSVALPFPGQYPGTNESVSISIEDDNNEVLANKSTPVGMNGLFSAEIPVSSVANGTYQIVYSYSGNNNLKPASDQSTSLTVQSTSTQTVVVSSDSSAPFGELLTFTATITGSGGTPTGSVVFKDGGDPLGSAVPVSKGQAQIQTSTLAIGLHSITAEYSSDNTTNFANSTSAAITQTVTKLNAALSALTPTQSVPVGTKVVLGGHISAGSMVPVGEAVLITFNGTTQLATIKSDGSFSQSFDTTNALPNTYAVTYSYAGSDTFTSATDSTTTVITLVWNGVVTPIITMNTSPNAIVQGATVTLTATVQPVGNVTPTGNVTFSETIGVDGLPLPGGVIVYGNADLVDGTATLTITATSNPTFTVGTHMLVATYGGDGGTHYTGATSQFYPFTVNASLGGSEQAGISLTVASGGSSTATVTRGTSVNLPLALSSKSGFSGDVALTCTPTDPAADVNCALSPSLVSLSGSTKAVMATITTVEASANANALGKNTLLFGGLGLIPFAFKRRRRLATLLSLIAIVTLTGVGCGGGHGSQLHYAKAGTYNFTVTASSLSGNSATSSVKLTVIVTE